MIKMSRLIKKKKQIIFIFDISTTVDYNTQII